MAKKSSQPIRKIKGKPLMGGEVEILPGYTPVGEIMARVMDKKKPKGNRKPKRTDEEKQERRGKTIRAKDGKLVDRPKRKPIETTPADVTETHTEPKHDARHDNPGRPSGFTPEIGDAICLSLMEGESLRAICDAEGMPHMATVMRWVAKGNLARASGDTGNEYAIFCEQYAHAREVQADVLVDEILTISDDGRNDWMEKFGRDGESIGWMVNGEAMQRSKLRVESRKWMAEKMNPKKYSPMQKLADADGNNIPVPEKTSDLDLARQIAFVLAGAAAKKE